MIVTLYAHGAEEDWEEDAEDQAKKTGADLEKVKDIFEEQPLYEVAFDFDVDTGKCVEVRTKTQTFKPA